MSAPQLFHFPFVQSAQPPHPAVVRVDVAERGASSHGSGSLVGVAGQYGLVVTNWHVVRDAQGEIAVIFPSGFRSSARILKVDPDWDLAALLIWRPNVQPIPIAVAAPRPGDVLTIAGYGGGQYRAALGRCTQYVAPGMRFPYEMVELSAQARQGDSGGPILNARGELAGVLFGAGQGTTSGSYCGRVRAFLESVFPQLDGADQWVASQAPSSTQPAAPDTPAAQSPPLSADLAADAPRRLGTPRRLTPRFGHSEGPAHRTSPKAAADSVATTATLPASQHRPRWQDIVGDTPPEQAKSLLAWVGILAVLLRLSNWFGRRQQ